MLVHWVMSDYQGTYEALVEAYKEGKLRAIGLSNFNQRQIRGIMERFDVAPAVLQNEMHIFHQQAEMRDFTKANGIQFESWAPFGEGAHDIFNHPVIATIGAKYGKSVAQVILRFITQEGVVAIPKSIRAERMAENFDIFDFDLTAEDLATLRGLNEDRGLFGVDHVLFGTDAPLGIAPAGATQVIMEAIESLPLTDHEKQLIFTENFQKLIKK